MDIETIIDDAKNDVEAAIRKVLPVAQEAATVAEDVRTLDVSALLADIENVVRSHVSAAGITDTAAGTKTSTTAPDVTKVKPADLPTSVAADLAAETSGEPADLAAATGAATGDTEPATGAADLTEAPAAPGDPEGITRAVPGPQ